MPGPSHTTRRIPSEADLREVTERFLKLPGVARVQLTPGDNGELDAEVTTWEKPAGAPEHGPLAELARLNPDELQFLHDEIFVGESYLQGGIVLRENSVVFDVGANIGIFSLFVGARCPSATVYAFEPIPPVYDRLRENVARHGAPVTPMCAGLSDRDQEVTFNFYPDVSIMSCRSDYADLDNETELVKKYVANARESAPADREQHLNRVASLVERDFERTAHRCRLRRLSTVLDEQPVDRIDLLKIDVQRSELDVLHGLDDRHWPLVRQIAVEVHDEPGTPTEGRVGHVRELLKRRGFRVAETEVDLLRGAGRYAVQAVRPEYASDPRPVAARAGSARPPEPDELRARLCDVLPAQLVPRHIRIR